MDAHATPPSSPTRRLPNNHDALTRWVGSRLVVGFGGTQPNDAGVLRAKELAERGKIGGLIFFSYNVVSPAQLQRLTASIRRWRVPAENRPLLLVVDQEGGRVARLSQSKGFHSGPSALALGQANDAVAKDALERLASEIRIAGLNLNAAPCVDVHHKNSPAIGELERSFSETPAVIVRRATQALDAHFASGVVPAIKHFPGHGSARGDTHRGITDVSEVFETQELDVFEAILSEKKCSVVLTSHLINKKLDTSGVPATFSRTIITDLLRNKLGFDGVAITDDLMMGAIGEQYGRADTYRLAFAAGHDLLCISNNQAALGKGLAPSFRDDPYLTERCVAAVRAGVAHGLLTEEMFQASERRLHALREQMREMELKKA